MQKESASPGRFFMPKKMDLYKMALFVDFSPLELKKPLKKPLETLLYIIYIEN